MQKSDNLSQNKTRSATAGFFDAANDLLGNLPVRSQEIVKKRFGLQNGEAETLERIGADYNITRERVRQIIADTVKKISKASAAESFSQPEEKIILKINQKDGIINEEQLIKELSSGSAKEANSIRFFAACSGKIAEIDEKGLIARSLVVSKDVVAKAKEVSAVAEEVLRASGKPMTDAGIAEEIIAKKKEFSKEQILNYLAVLIKISKNKFGRWGFSDWMEINPKGTRERIYMVLKEKNKPLHFTQIARLIDEFKLSKKKSHPQTVHNELIKDERFVLIGRGIYALTEWGYTAGTIKDVLEDILKKSGRMMSKEEILEEIAKVRQVKKATVMINLNGNKRFIKTNNKYSLKK